MKNVYQDTDYKFDRRKRLSSSLSCGADEHLLYKYINERRWDDPHDGVSCPFDHHTVYSTECQVRSSTAGNLVDCRSQLPHQPSWLPPGCAVNNRPTAVAVYITLA